MLKEEFWKIWREKKILHGIVCQLVCSGPGFRKIAFQTAKPVQIFGSG
jgi:hypothetical protein